MSELRMQFQAIGKLLGSNALVALCGFAGSIILFRSMAPADIGSLYPLIGFMLLMDQCADLGFSTSYVSISAQQGAKDKSAAAELYRQMLGFRIIVTVVCLAGMIFFLPFISRAFFAEAPHRDAFLATALATAVSIMGNFYTAEIQARSRFTALSLMRLVPNVIKLSMIAVFATLKILTLPMALAAFLAVPVGQALWGMASLGREALHVKIPRWQRIQPVMSMTRWVIISTVAVAFIGQAGLLQLSRMSGPDEVASFAGASRIAGALLVFAGALTSALLPRVSAMTETADLRRYVALYFKALPVVVVGACLGIALAGPLITGLLSEKYAHSVGAFRIMIAQSAVDLWITPLSLVLYRLRLAVIFPLLNITQLAVLVGLNFAFIPRWGAEGVAWTGLIIRCLAVPVVLEAIRRHGLLWSSESGEKKPLN